ncbi:hypothetical protein CC2G_007113 [Coprinopsis cinerea AmutBmut pab1-1]|nr:hypothetical protein CC2G_007113 [Coprinopsis cinerea AmutBmut pab1-1]
MTYQTMAEDVRHFLETHGLNNVSLLGHSMGAKVAMSIALSLAEKNPKDETISRLIVADMAPVKAELSIRLSQYISAMQDVNAMPAGMIKSLPDADRILAHFEQNPAVRQFLLTNLLLPSHSRTSHTHEKAKFALPLSILQDALPDLAEFPYDHKEATHPTFDRPTLVISGTHSEYRILDHTKAFKTFFPRAKLESLDAGHWVHAERPNEFKKLVVDFIKST